MADLTTLDIKTILSLVELLEAIGTEYVAVQEAGGTYKRISIDNLKKTFIPYSGAVSNIDLGSKELTTTGDITAANLVYITDIINDLTTGGTTDVLSAEQGKVLKIAVDLLNDAVGVAGSVLHSIKGHAETATFTPTGGIAAVTLATALAELDTEIVLLNAVVGTVGSVLHSIKGHAENATFTPTGSIVAVTIATALAELDAEIINLNAAVGVAGSVLKMIKDNAENATFTPTGDISAVTIALAIAELDTEKEKLANKKTDLSDDSDTYYPSQKAVKTVTDALTVVDEGLKEDTNHNTQLIASKDQANLNAHNSIQRRLAVAEAETYNGTDLENTEPTNEVGVATDGTDISASVEDGSVELTTEGKSFENLIENGDFANGTTNFSSDDYTLSAASNILTAEVASLSATARVQIRDAPFILNHIYFVMFDIKAIHANFTSLSIAGIGFQADFQSQINAGSWSHVGKRFTGTTGADAYIYHKTDTNYSLTDEIFLKNIISIDLTALNLDAVLTTDALCFAYFNYVNGLASSLPHDVESVNSNFIDKTKVIQGGLSSITGIEEDSDIYMRTGFIKVSALTELTAKVDATYTYINIRTYDSNFNYLGDISPIATEQTYTTLGASAYIRHVIRRIDSVALDSDDFIAIRNSAQLNLGAAALPYQPHKTNYAHCPVTLNQVPTARDTFDFRTGVLGVNVSGTYTLSASYYDSWSAAGTNIEVLTLDVSIGVLPDWSALSTFALVSGWTQTAEDDWADSTDMIGTFYIIYASGLIKFAFAKATSEADAKLEVYDELFQHELADASKYTVQYPPQNLIAYSGGQMSRIPKLRDNGISTGGTVSMGTIPMSRMGDVYEYVGAESSLVDPDDITLAGDGLSFDVAGGGDDEVYDFVGFYDTSYSTYPTQQVQYTTDNSASKVAYAVKAVTEVTTATYDMLKTDNVLLVSYTSTAAVTSLTISSDIIAQTGRVITIKDSGNNASVNNITIDTEGAETIEGAATLVMSTNRETVKLITDGSNLHILS